MTDISLDLDLIDANLRELHDAASQAGVAVRGHLKAHRTHQLARRQLDAGAIGIAVQTAHAAKVLASHGIDDCVVAWPWDEPWRFEAYAQTAETLDRLTVHVATEDQVHGIGAAASARGVEVRTRIDLRHVPDEDLIALALACERTAGVVLDGVTSYSAPQTFADIAGRQQLGREHAARVVAAAERIRDSGVPVETVCIGGTPTAASALEVSGVTEICSGAYATLDGGLVAAGAAPVERVAISVDAARMDLIEGSSQPWASDIDHYPATAPGRLVPAHICPFALSALRSNTGWTVISGGQHVDTWQPFAAPDRS